MKEPFRVETAVSQNVTLNYSANESIFTLELLKHNVVYSDNLFIHVERMFSIFAEKCWQM